MDSFASLDVLWGRAATNLRDKLIEAKTPACMFRILENFLLSQMRGSLPPRSAVAFALQEMQKFSKPRPIAAIIGQLGISPRHFIQIFREEVGTAPKLFYRIQRFQRVVRRVEAANEVDWGDLSVACGYYDQAHLIHDFRTFSGCTPTDYLRRKTGRLNHVAL